MTKARAILIIGGMALMAHTSRATLIGDDVTVQHHYSNWITPLQTLGTVTVESGTGDLVGLLPGYTVDIGGTSAAVDFNMTGVWTGSAYNGLLFSSLDFYGGTGGLLGLEIDTNMRGWTDSR